MESVTDFQGPNSISNHRSRRYSDHSSQCYRIFKEITDNCMSAQYPTQLKLKQLRRNSRKVSKGKMSLRKSTMVHPLELQNILKQKFIWFILQNFRIFLNKNSSLPTPLSKISHLSLFLFCFHNTDYGLKYIFIFSCQFICFVLGSFCLFCWSLHSLIEYEFCEKRCCISRTQSDACHTQDLNKYLLDAQMYEPRVALFSIQFFLLFCLPDLT